MKGSRVWREDQLLAPVGEIFRDQDARAKSSLHRCHFHSFPEPQVRSDRSFFLYIFSGFPSFMGVYLANVKRQSLSLFKNLTTFASVSPVWTRGTTLEEKETQHYTVVRGSTHSGPGAESRASICLPLQSDWASSPVCVQTF